MKKSLSKLPEIVESMYPPSTTAEQELYHLEYSMRIFPYDQDTGGFYIAVFERMEEAMGVEGGAQITSVTAPGIITPILSHQAEVSILKNICGFNPKQQEGSHAPGSVNGSGRDELLAFKQACNVYTYEPMAEDNLKQLQMKMRKSATPQDMHISSLHVNQLVGYC